MELTKGCLEQPLASPGKPSAHISNEGPQVVSHLHLGLHQPRLVLEALTGLVVGVRTSSERTIGHSVSLRTKTGWHWPGASDGTPHSIYFCEAFGSSIRK